MKRFLQRRQIQWVDLCSFGRGDEIKNQIWCSQNVNYFIGAFDSKQVHPSQIGVEDHRSFSGDGPWNELLCFRKRE